VKPELQAAAIPFNIYHDDAGERSAFHGSVTPKKLQILWHLTMPVRDGQIRRLIFVILEIPEILAIIVI
jgi:hypothetical protein